MMVPQKIKNRDFPGRLRLHTSNEGDMGSIPGLGTKIPYAVRRCSQKKIFLIKKNFFKVQLKIELTYDPTIPLLGIYTKELKAGS